MPGELLAANDFQAAHMVDESWDEPDAVADIAFAAGLLGLVAGLLAVIRFTSTRFPDAVFWQALPLLLTLPPALFLAALYAPGGWLDDRPGGRRRAAGLALSGLFSYLAPLFWLAMVAALACLR